MKLTWNINGCKNPKVNVSSKVTHFLIWATIPVGMNEITAKNVDEFIERLEVLKMLDRAEYAHMLGNKATCDYPTPAQVRAHIGLTTNAVKVARAKWIAKSGKELMRVARLNADV